MRDKLLLIDDDVFLQRSLIKLLKGNGFDVEVAASSQEALRALQRIDPDLIILDVGLPDGDGYEFCQELRKNWTVPIIMLTARGDVSDRVTGLQSGADDYLPKPFSPDELLARIRAHLRRRTEYTQSSRPKQIGDLVIDNERRDAIIRGKPAGLKNREFELLIHLAINAGKALTREALFTHSWGYEMSFNTNSLDVYIYRLRQKIELDPDNPEYIHTLRGYGYKLEYIPNH